MFSCGRVLSLKLRLSLFVPPYSPTNLFQAVSPIFASIGCCCPPIPFSNRPWYLSINMLSFILPFFPSPSRYIAQKCATRLPTFQMENSSFFPQVYINLHQFPVENSETLRCFCTQPHLHTNSHWRKSALGHLLTSVTPEISQINWNLSPNKKSWQELQGIPNPALQTDLVRLSHVFVDDIAWSPEMPPNRLRNWYLEGPHVGVRASVKWLYGKTLNNVLRSSHFWVDLTFLVKCKQTNEAKTFNCFSHLPLSEDVVFPVRMLCLCVWNPPDSARSRRAALPKSEPHRSHHVLGSISSAKNLVLQFIILNLQYLWRPKGHFEMPNENQMKTWN